MPGSTPAKWARVWQQRHRGTPLHLVPVAAAAAEDALLAGHLDAALLRPPVDRDRLHAIPLYEEVPVVLLSRDHVLAALEPHEEVTQADLVEEVLLQPADDVLPWAGRPGATGDAADRPGRPPIEEPSTTEDAVALVAAGVGVAVVPQSLARLHHRKDVMYRPLAGGPSATVALAWVIEREDDRTEDLIGIVRGRTVNSSRGRTRTQPSDQSGAERAPGSRSSGQRQPRGRAGRRGRRR